MRKRAKSVEVTRGKLIGTGKTKTEAKADLDRQIDTLCLESEPYIEVRFGCLIVVARIGRHISSQIIFADDLQSHGKRKTFTSFGTDTFRSEIIRARMNAAQSMWNQSYIDDSFVEGAGLDEQRASELRSWINFQRSYNNLIDSGKTPAEAHQLALRA